MREADEYESGHIKGAIHVPLSHFLEAMKVLDKKNELLCCLFLVDHVHKWQHNIYQVEGIKSPMSWVACQHTKENLIMECSKPIINRVKRSEGQIKGVLNMMQSGKSSCEEILTQLKAIRSSIDQTIAHLTTQNL